MATKKAAEQRPIEVVDERGNAKTIDVSQFGKYEATEVSVQPVVDNAQSKELGYNVISMAPVITHSAGTQPALSISEALQLGPQQWRPFSRRPGMFTCVIQGRRFIIDGKTKAKLS